MSRRLIKVFLVSGIFLFPSSGSEYFLSQPTLLHIAEGLNLYSCYCENLNTRLIPITGTYINEHPVV
jgi:hypothetical protein